MRPNKLIGRRDATTADAAGVVRQLTHTEIAKQLGLSRSRVWQIERAAIAKVRRLVQRAARDEGLTVREWLFAPDEEPEDEEQAE